jgi:hypothetical protein
LGSGRRGNVTKSLLVSSALFAAEVLSLRSMVEDGRTDHENAAFVIVVGVPVVQVILSTFLHAQSGER